MSVESNIFTKESICATCLSQDRKLVTVRDSQLCTIFCSEFSLSQTDLICWECHHMVRKMVCFKRKAQKAQASLRFVTNGQNYLMPEYVCLSSLSISAGITLMITDTHSTNSVDQNPTTSNVFIKTEPLEDIVMVDKGVLPINNVGKVKAEVVSSDYVNEEINDEQTSDAKKQIACTGKHVTYAYCQVLTHKKQKPLVEKKIRYTKKQPSGTKKQVLHSGKDSLSYLHKIRDKRGDVVVVKKPESIYTEKIMTEDEIVDWRKKKENMKFYTNSIPLERCEKCLEPFDSLALRRAHVKRHTEIFGDIVCDICTMRVSEDREMAVHKRWHYRLLSCRHCDFVWDNVNTLRRHCQEYHNITQTLWDCELCERQFESALKLRVHERAHNREKCGECGILVINMKCHMLQHAGGVPLVTCPVCRKHYRGKHGLEIHLQTHRKQIDPAAYCTQCQTQYRNISGYLNHLRNSRKHATDIDYKHKCDTCDMRFLRAAALQRHIRTVHEEGPKHPCDQCGQFYNAESLRRHVRQKHQKKKQAEFICDYCGKVFKTKVLLSMHINTHTGARPFVCHLCGADFGHSSARYLHLRYKHKIPKKTDKTRSKTN